VKGPLGHLELTIPAVAAPMAGGPTTPAMVIEAARVGSFGFLAGGYKTPQLLAQQIAEVRATTSSFGVNLFAPNPVPVDRSAFRHYAATIKPEADRYDLVLDGDAPVEDDDAWEDKVGLLLADPVPVVSFTFGLPAPDTLEAFRRCGTVVIQSVTSPEEAVQASALPVDILAVQSGDAGGHWGTLTPAQPPTLRRLPDLVRAVRLATALPIVGAGGIGSAADVRAALEAGADAVMVGTLLLLTPESGASATYQKALASAGDIGTVSTRAFSGRPARALPNLFIKRYDPLAPLGYPAVHHLTTPLRRAAAQAGDSERINLWAGTGYRQARAESTGDALIRLTAPL
jgi:nitronate monooxygenase